MFTQLQGMAGRIVHVICITPDGRLLMTRKTIQGSNYHGQWSVTLAKNINLLSNHSRNFEEVVKEMLFSTFDIHIDELDDTDLVFGCSCNNDSPFGGIDVYIITLPGAVTLRMSGQTEARAMKEEELLSLLLEEPGSFGHDTKIVLNTALTD